MKSWRWLLMGALAGWVGAVSVRADETTPDRDYVQIEKTTASGVKVQVVEGTDAGAGAEPVAAAGPANAAESAPTSGAPASPALAEPHKARLAVLSAIFSKQFHPVFKFSEKIEISGQANLKMVFTTEHESRLEAPSFTLALSEAFVNSRKFDVLERARLAETLKEIDFGESDYADAGKVVPMGKAMNAEYVVLPEIDVIQLEAEAEEVPYVGVVKPVLKGKMLVRSRIVDTASTKVVSACTEEVQVERKLKENDPFLETEINNLVVDLYRATSLRLLHRALESIYPVRLLEIDGGVVVLNRGEGAIQVGDEFEVFALGRAHVDPDTHETLDRRETRVGLIRVVRVAPKSSDAEIAEGQDALVGDPGGFLCRETAASIRAKTTASRTKINW